MGYSDWVNKHAAKHQIIVKKLLAQGFNEDEIIEYFDFENMKDKEIDFCPLYAKNQKCHDMESLNCYLCSCPNFRFNDEGIQDIDEKKQYSYCNIDSKDGRQGVYGEKIHQDCSGCSVPHHKEYVKKHFDFDWMKIMSPCEKKS
ncbi:hypothetical protein [Sulfurimonas sp.]